MIVLPLPLPLWCLLKVLLVKKKKKKTADVLIDSFADAKHPLNPVQLIAATFTPMSSLCNANGAV